MNNKLLYQEALDFHSHGKPGKYEINPTKSLATQKDLALAYSPGVAAPCQEIAKNPDEVYKYTTKGNTVAVISNGTAVLGLGNIGALASKPVMEGKAVLFKRFSDIDAVDLEVDTQDVDEFIQAVRYLGPTFGGINLEDIKAPECFIIEERLKNLMDIPVFHDDQHGTSIAVVAGMINAMHLTNKKLFEVRIVINGAGAAAISCAKLLLKMGAQLPHITMLDREGVIYQGRLSGLNPWKELFATTQSHRTLHEALQGADVFLGLSSAQVLTPEMVYTMAPQPIIFAMANPEPEVRPELVYTVRPDAIVATGRSDYPNQVNNALCFPYVFRGALDVRASEINDEMKIAAAEAIARLAREDVPEEVNKAYVSQRLRYGPQYIIPVPFDPRLIEVVPPAVAKAAMETGVARKPIKDLVAYGRSLRRRIDPTYSNLEIIFSMARAHPKTIIFAEGEEDVAIRAAIYFHTQGLGNAVLVGREDYVKEHLDSLGLTVPKGLLIHNAKLGQHNENYIQFLYERLQRKGFLYRDCQRLVHQDRNIFSACAVALGDADGMVTGLTRDYTTALHDIQKVIDTKPGLSAFGLSVAMVHGHALFIADTSVHECPSAQTLANMVIQSAEYARFLGHIPRVAMVSHSNFNGTEVLREAITLLDQQKVAFEYEGPISVSVALNMDLHKQYPFSRLTQPANILIMPDLNSASITTQLLDQIQTGTTLGPWLMGLTHSVQIAPMTVSATQLAHLASFAATQ